jgi:hypothetical protein
MIEHGGSPMEIIWFVAGCIFGVVVIIQLALILQAIKANAWVAPRILDRIEGAQVWNTSMFKMTDYKSDVST